MEEKKLSMWQKARITGTYTSMIQKLCGLCKADIARIVQANPNHEEATKKAMEVCCNKCRVMIENKMQRIADIYQNGK